MHFQTLAPVPRSPLAERYPCENCHGEGYGEKQVDVDEFDDDECVECHGSGADEDAGLTAYIDDWMSRNGITVSTHSEHYLRELLISTAAGHDSWGERDEPGDSPIVATPERHEIETYVSDLTNTLLRESRDSGSPAPYASAFGTFHSIVERLLLAWSQGTPLSAAIQEERRIREKVACATDGGTAGKPGESGSPATQVLPRDLAVAGGRRDPSGDGVRSADSAGQSDDRSGQVASPQRGSLIDATA